MSYYPHLTPTQTGSDNPIRIVNDIRKFKSKVPVNVYYTMRTYMTRHGDGPMRHEVKSSSELSENIKEFTNVTNKFQGEFRYGRISPKEIRTALKFDMNKWDGMRNIHHNLVITHADETDGKVLMHNGTYSCVGAAKCVGFNKNSLYVSYGPMNRDIKKYSDK